MQTLATLPNELIHQICSYIAFDLHPNAPHPPLLALSESDPHLRSVIEEYSRLLLKRHSKLDIKLPKKISDTTCRRWIRWLSSSCWYCRKNSRRKAILDPDVTCCSKCDKERFPKMTMTDAMRKHGLTKLDLFTPNEKHPDLPPLVHGSYVCMGGVATMFAEAGVLARKELLHGKKVVMQKAVPVVEEKEVSVPITKRSRSTR